MEGKSNWGLGGLRGGVSETPSPQQLHVITSPFASPPSAGVPPSHAIACPPGCRPRPFGQAGLPSMTWDPLCKRQRPRQLRTRYLHPSPVPHEPGFILPVFLILGFACLRVFFSDIVSLTPNSCVPLPPWGAQLCTVSSQCFDSWWCCPCLSPNKYVQLISRNKSWQAAREK